MSTFRPTQKQIEAHHLLQHNRVVLYGGAIRGAKSYWGCMEIITYCFQYPNSRWLMLRKSLPVIKNTLLKTFTENFLNKGWSQYVKSFHETTLLLKWNNGSEILFMSESYDDDKQLNRFKGLEINGAFIDEVNEIQESTYNKIIERTGSWFHSPGCPAKIILTCNPTQNWVKDRFYTPYRQGTLPTGHAYLQACIYDNPYIPADYLESLQQLPRYQYDVFVNGNWDLTLKTGGEFYKCFELDQHVAETCYNPLLPLHISFDDNVNPYLPVGVFQIISVKPATGLAPGSTGEGYHLVMINEIAGVNPRNTVKAVCDEIIRLYPGHQSGLFIYGDATASKSDTKLQPGFNFFRLILQNLSQYKPQSRVLPFNPSVAMRGNWINTILEKQIGGIKITIGSHCKKTINDLLLLKESADGTKLKETETGPTGARQQKIGHFTDLLDYLLCSAFSAQYLRYQKGTDIPALTFGKNKQSKNIF